MFRGAEDFDGKLVRHRPHYSTIRDSHLCFALDRESQLFRNIAGDHQVHSSRVNDGCDRKSADLIGRNNVVFSTCDISVIGEKDVANNVCTADLRVLNIHHVSRGSRKPGLSSGGRRCWSLL